MTARALDRLSNDIKADTLIPNPSSTDPGNFSPTEAAEEFQGTLIEASK